MGRLFSIVQFRMIVVLCLGAGVAMSSAIWLLGGTMGWSGNDRALLAFGVPGAALLIVIPIVLFAVRPWVYVRDIDDMLGGRAWAHWRYTDREWRAANRLEGRRTRTAALTSALLGLGLGIAVAAAGAAATNRDLRTSLVFAGTLTAGMSLVVLLTVLVTSPATLARRRRSGEIYVSPVGVYRRPGGYTAMIAFGTVLHNVQFVDGDPPYVRFDALVQSSAGPTKQRWADVAVPAGRADEARRLVERFRTEVLGTVR
jgi:hypothetical protein